MIELAATLFVIIVGINALWVIGLLIANFFAGVEMTLDKRMDEAANRRRLEKWIREGHISYPPPPTYH